MDFKKVVATRRSIRSFTEKDVTKEQVDTIIRAAMMAPSAGNQKPWHFIVIRDREKLTAVPQFHPFAKMVAKVPVAILICGDPEGKKWPAFWVQDCSAATQNLLLAARDLGLGTVWTGVYPEQERMAGCRKLFAIPDHIIPFSLIPVGWPDGEFKELDRFNPSQIHLESW